MSRWAIWSQVGLAVIGLVATFADRGTVSRSLLPPQFVVVLCFMSVLVLPVAALESGRRRQPGGGRIVVGVATIGLALATLFALLPLVQ